MLGRYVHSTTTHTSLLKTRVTFNKKTLKTIKQYMYNMILPLKFPHIYLHDRHLFKPHKKTPYTYTACISLNQFCQAYLINSRQMNSWTNRSFHLRYTQINMTHENCIERANFVCAAINTTTYGLSSWRYLAAKLWNLLPASDRTNQTFTAFKTVLKKIDLAAGLTFYL